MKVQTILAVVVILLGAGDRIFAATHALVQPIKPPKKAETAEEKKKIRIILAVGARQKKAWRGAPILKDSGRSIKGKYLPRLPSYHKRIGYVGLLATPVKLTEMRVLQVLDKDSMLILVPRNLAIRGEQSDGVKGDETIRVKGFSTSGIVDGDTITIGILLEVKGTEQYPTADGTTRTVFLLEPFPLRP